MGSLAKVIVSGVVGAAAGVGLCVLPAAFGQGGSGRNTFDWLIAGWPGVWVFATLAASLITIPMTFLVFALWGPRYSVAERLARQAYQQANGVHPEPYHDREMGMLAGALAGLCVCAAVPPLLEIWSTAPPEIAFRGNALADLVVVSALVAGIIAKLVFLELQLRNPTY